MVSVWGGNPNEIHPSKRSVFGAVTLVFWAGGWGRGRCGRERGKKAGPRALPKVLTPLRHHPGEVLQPSPALRGLCSSPHRFTQNLSVFRRDVAEALRSDGGADPCGLDMMS